MKFNLLLSLLTLGIVTASDVKASEELAKNGYPIPPPPPPPPPPGCSPNGRMVCSGTGFQTCDNGRWVYRDCGPGTVCRPFNGSILCDYPPQGPQRGYDHYPPPPPPPPRPYDPYPPPPPPPRPYDPYPPPPPPPRPYDPYGQPPPPGPYDPYPNYNSKESSKKE